MTNLMLEIDKQLKICELQPISDVINNKKESMKYINRILSKYGNKVTIPFQLARDKYDFRVKHVLFSFGLGMLIASFSGLKEKINELYKVYQINNPFTYTWLTLCLYHDLGYFIGSSYLKTDNIDDLQIDYNIFHYQYCKSRYSKELYVEYYKDKYKKQNWSINNYDLEEYEEVGDHGILGGYMLFQQLCDSEIKNEPPKKTSLLKKAEDANRNNQREYHFEKIPFYQDICYRIMEHNIWKRKGIFDSSNPFHEIDEKHFKAIDIKEPLLYLLSLVDTIEMTKNSANILMKRRNKIIIYFLKH